MDFYTGPTLKGFIVADRGYRLVRAIDEMVRAHWFDPYQPIVNFHARGPDEIFIEIKDFPPLKYSITITKGDCIDG